MCPDTGETGVERAKRARLVLAIRCAASLVLVPLQQGRQLLDDFRMVFEHVALLSGIVLEVE